MYYFLFLPFHLHLNPDPDTDPDPNSNPDPDPDPNPNPDPDLFYFYRLFIQLGYRLGEFIVFRAAEYFHMKMILIDEEAVNKAGK